MAKYTAKNFRETTKILNRLAKKNEELLAAIQSDFPLIVLNAGRIIQARAQEIITEKGHVVTGNLKRSISTTIEVRSTTRVEAIVGTFVEYAPFVENLPDGGFMFEATVQTYPAVARYLVEQGIRPAEADWASQ